MNATQRYRLLRENPTFWRPLPIAAAVVAALILNPLRVIPEGTACAKLRLGKVQDQPLLPGRVFIGQGAWVGYGVFIAGNVSLGEHSVVGANSVVTRSVPAYTVVAGAPAEPVRRYSHELGKWVKVN